LAAPIHDEFREKLVVYHQAYDNWLRKYLGCPPRATNINNDGYETVQCDPSMGGMDLGMWKKSREAAKALYGLKDKEE
jgi:hypothetical protein